MTKTFLALAAGAALFVCALPGPADASERRADGGVRNTVEQTEFSSRHRSWHRPRYAVRRGYYRPYYAAPYGYGYGYPYGYYRPAPVFGLGFGAPVFGLGFGFGPRLWW